MGAQSSYPLRSSANYPGQIADIAPMEIEAYLVETAAGIAPGYGVSLGSSDNQCVLGGTVPIGVVVRALDTENNVSDEIVYPLTKDVGVMIQGNVVVPLSNTGTKGDQIFMDNTSGQLGAGVAASGATQMSGELAETITAVGNARVRLVPQVF